VVAIRVLEKVVAEGSPLVPPLGRERVVGVLYRVEDVVESVQ